MDRPALPRRLAGITFAVLILMASATIAADKRAIPSVDEIEALTENYFAGQPKYRPGEIISQSQVRGLLEELWRHGWKVPRKTELLRRVPDDSELLVREPAHQRRAEILAANCSLSAGLRQARSHDAHADGQKHSASTCARPRRLQVAAVHGRGARRYPTRDDAFRHADRKGFQQADRTDLHGVQPDARGRTRHEESFQAIRRSQAKVWGLKTPKSQ